MLLSEEKAMVVILTLVILTSGILMLMLEFKSVLKELSNVVLFSRMLSVLIVNFPTKPSERCSSAPRSCELALLLLFVFRTCQDFLASSPVRISTVFRTLYKGRDIYI